MRPDPRKTTALAGIRLFSNMGRAHFAIMAFLISALMAGCSQLLGAPAPAPTSTPRPTSIPVSAFSATPTDVPAPVMYRPTPTPDPYSIPAPVHTPAPKDPDVIAVERRCFYPDTSIPDDLMQPLAEIVDRHTTRTIETERGAFRVEVGYFLDFHRSGHLDDAHKPVSTPTPAAWDPDLMNHPFLTYDVGYLPPASHVVVRDEDSWKFTLYGLMPPHPYHGEGMWALRAEATMDVATCEATLEKLVAGPDEIVLYPEDEG